MSHHPNPLPADSSQPPSVWVRHTLNVAGICIPAIERPASTPGHKPAIILLHGLMASAETLLELIAELPTDRRIIAPDLLLAYPEPASLNFEAVAGLVPRLLDALELDRAVIVGHSYGGALALRLASSYPERVDALVLLCPAHPFDGYDPVAVRFYLSPPGRLLAHSMPSLPPWLQAFGIRRMAGRKNTIQPKNVERYRRTLREPGLIPLLLRVISTWNDDMYELREALSGAPLAAPTLFLWGDRDPVVPIKTAPKLQRHIVLWEQFTIRNGGHLLADEAPKECGPLIRTWLIWRESHPLYVASRGLTPVSTQTPPPPTP